MGIIIKTDAISFFYEPAEEGKHAAPALDHVSLEIMEGSFTAILGPNGSGKSTLAKNLNALYLPSQGKVYVAGMDTENDALVWNIRQTAGMVFQNPDNQIVASVVEEDVAFGLENLGVPPEEIRTRIEEAMSSVGILELRDQNPSRLSGGQKQRVAIAGIIAMRPRCIIFDEPTAMLDPRGRREVRDIIHKLHEEGITIILITHFMEEAAEADRVIVMKDGRVISDADPETTFRDSSILQASGLELPPAIRLRNRLRDCGIPVPDRVMTIPALAEYLCGSDGKIQETEEPADADSGRTSYVHL